MNRYTPKRAAHNRYVEPRRNEFRQSHLHCQRCYVLFASELHEMTRGPAREAALGEWAALLHLCHGCHVIVQDWEIAKQLALKLVSDSKNFSLTTINKLRGRKPSSAIILADVVQHLEVIE